MTGEYAMKKNNEYQTTAGSPFAPFRIPVGTFIAMTLFSLIALKYSLLIFWIMIGAGILGAVLQYFQMRNTFSHWQVVFKEKTLYLTCLLRKKTRVIEDLTYSDFLFGRQSDGQKEKNIGSVLLRGKPPISLDNIHDFSLFKQYIENNF